MFFYRVKNKESAKYKFKKLIQKDLGDEFIVKEFFKNKCLFYTKMVNTEKIAVYLIFILILIVTMITLIGSLTIFILQKKEDMFILITLGASSKMLKNIFMTGTYYCFYWYFFRVILG